MNVAPELSLDALDLADFCRRHGIIRLSVFGSALTDRLRPDSDVDLLVEFDAGRIPGLLGMAALERELSELIGGREVDLRTAGDLSPRFRDQVRNGALELYAAA